MDDARLLRIGTLSFHSNDLNETISIHEYLHKLLSTLWEEQDGFSGKRPFGNSGWAWEIFACLIRFGEIPGKLDEYGDVEEGDFSDCEQIIREYIEMLSRPKMKPCRMCHNARLDDELTDDNDGAYISVGKTATHYRIGIGSGMGKPLRIEFEHWDDKRQENIVVGRYLPKFCPECGRPIVEYEVTDNG